jgi:hypothetical protein
MNFSGILIASLGMFAFSASADLTLKNGSDINMNGSTASQIVFPDGTTQSTAPTPHVVIPAGHGGTDSVVTGPEAFVCGGRN